MQNDNSKLQIIIRLIPGITFLLEGIQKFLYVDQLGVGRFLNFGIPHAIFWSPFVGVVEIVFGTLLVLGLKTKLSTIPLLIVMIVAFIYTKRPILVSKGFFPMFHEYRTDYAMTLSLVYLLIAGGGFYSLDHFLFRKKNEQIISK